MLIFIYVVLIFLILRFSVTIFNFLSNPKLGKYGKHFTDKVAVIIDARINSPGMATLLHSLQKQDYQHMEVLLHCHRKSENFEQLHEICTADPRFRTVGEINPAEVAAEYLLFLQPETVVVPGLFDSLIYRAKVFDLAVLSIIPRQTSATFRDKIMLPVSDFILLNLVPLRLVRLFSSPAFSTSDDKCLFFSAQAYRKYAWQPGRDVVKAVKLDQLKAETLLGDRLIYTAPTATQQLFPAYGKRLLLIFGNNIPAALLYVLLVIAGPVYMLSNAEYELLIMPVGLIFLTRIMISFLVRQNPVVNLLLHPLQMLFLCIALLNAIFLRIFNYSTHKRA
ncbi:glycosyltransferase [Pedobacter sp. AW31-3R]|uniref:glycosyltransferase n=1 Tax=Pedobacter sp. AW31-3R TaxID=3445781 RepID=UPI003FA09558